MTALRLVNQSAPGSDATQQQRRVGVIGCGAWGQNLVRNFSSLGSLAAVADSSAEGAERAQQLAPQASHTSDARTILADRSIEAVVIATPASTHAALAEAALLAGKDVFVEKPMALRYDEGKKLVRLAEEHGRILMVGHVLEYHPAVVAIETMLAAGELGILRYVYSNRLAFGRVRSEENILFSFAPHDVALILRLAGALPFEVISCGGAYLQPAVADVMVTHLLFDSGLRAHIHASWLHPFREHRLVVVGSKATLTFDGATLSRTEQPADWSTMRGSGSLTPVPFASDEPLRLECEAFLEAVRTRVPPRSDGASGLRVLKVLQAAQRSLVNNGRPVQLGFEEGP